jgi:hypothetical protein
LSLSRNDIRRRRHRHRQTTPRSPTCATIDTQGALLCLAQRCCSHREPHFFVIASHLDIIRSTDRQYSIRFGGYRSAIGDASGDATNTLLIREVRCAFVVSLRLFCRYFVYSQQLVCFFQSSLARAGLDRFFLKYTSPHFVF